LRHRPADSSTVRDTDGDPDCDTNRSTVGFAVGDTNRGTLCDSDCVSVGVSKRVPHGSTNSRAFGHTYFCAKRGTQCRPNGVAQRTSHCGSVGCPIGCTKRGTKRVTVGSAERKPNVVANGSANCNSDCGTQRCAERVANGVTVGNTHRSAYRWTKCHAHCCSFSNTDGDSLGRSYCITHGVAVYIAVWCTNGCTQRGPECLTDVGTHFNANLSAVGGTFRIAHQGSVCWSNCESVCSAISNTDRCTHCRADDGSIGSTDCGTFCCAFSCTQQCTYDISDCSSDGITDASTHRNAHGNALGRPVCDANRQSNVCTDGCTDTGNVPRGHRRRCGLHVGGLQQRRGPRVLPWNLRNLPALPRCC
jgi:hypothetical protein